MSFKLNRKTVFNIIIILAVIITIIAAIYAIIGGRQYVTRRSLRGFGLEIKAFGLWAPLIIFGLMMVTTLIPPIPIPTSFIEVAGGLIFGFWPGLVLIWLSQLISSLCLFTFPIRWQEIFLLDNGKLDVFLLQTVP